MSQANWRVAGACVAGARHVRANQPCQDAIGWKRLPNNSLIIALADGAGSALQAEAGARLAVASALEFLEAQLVGPALAEASLRTSLQDAFKAACDRVAKTAADAGSTPRAYASTLLLCVIQEGSAAAAQIGDGAALLRPSNGPWEALTKPCVEEYLNETVFLQSEGSIQKMQFRFWEGTPGNLALFSDGLQLLALKMPEASPHSPFLDPLARFVEGSQDEAATVAELENFLRSSRVSQRTDDDLSLVLAVRKET